MIINKNSMVATCISPISQYFTKMGKKKGSKKSKMTPEEMAEQEVTRLVV